MQSKSLSTQDSGRVAVLILISCRLWLAHQEWMTFSKFRHSSGLPSLGMAFIIAFDFNVHPKFQVFLLPGSYNNIIHSHSLSTSSSKALVFY
ncbi:hypothetical protein FPOAC1_011268 [Fusarium poae]|uniref:hypothetical protein n=1 Tax=Fusarium poae TaxID=36050 RepID=UPI001CEB8AD7|nr:hypothetical protein FPOAC1_011268 [Fusarium poae]KAG8666461.1 hypothetical protein FPOAC1_011268 [Fusarium poae]